MTGGAPAELDYEPDPAVWLVGPTDARPPHVWLPGAVEVLCQDFSIQDDQGRQFVTAVLEMFLRDDESALSERLLRWRDPMDDPFPVQLGMVAREFWSDEDLDQYLNGLDLPIVERALIDTIEGGRASHIRRGMTYSHQDGVLVVSVRYVIESRSRSLVGLLHTASDIPGQVIEALDDLDELARAVEIRGETS